MRASQTYSRRTLLRLSGLGLAGVAVSSLLSACGGITEGQPSLPKIPTVDPAAEPVRPAASPPAVAVRPTATAMPPTGTPPSLTRPAASPTVAAARSAAPGVAARAGGPIGAGSRIPWSGQDWFLNGANVPWLHWGRDFGGGAKDGVSNPQNRKSLAAGFGEAKANGVNVIRWWVFEGDAWQVKRDGSGAPTDLDEAIYADFDAALDLAEQLDLYYVFVLFSAPQHIPSSWMENPDRRDRLGSALGPLFARYRDSARIMTWEVFNEPEFDVWDKRVKEEPMKATIKEVARSVHANSRAYCTVGGAMLDGLPMLKGLGLDYYQAHWYDYMEKGNWCALCTTYDEVRRRYDLDAPLVIGEIYLSADLENPHLRLEDFYSKGYAGVWPWSIFPDATQDKYAIDWNSMRIFAGRHADFGPRTTDALPASTAAPTLRLTIRSAAQVATQRITPGQRQTLDVKVTATAAVKALVDVELYHASGEKALQQVYEDQAFRPGETKAYTIVWTPPPEAAPGDYVVKVGVFAPGWGKRYDWNDAAARFTVVR